MKKNMKKILLSSVAALGFAAIGVSTTFALFTDNAEASIETSAGKVSVKQTLSIQSVKELGDVSASYNETTKVYTNSVGSKTYVDANNQSALHLEKWVPGDKAVIRFVTENNSNVKIKTKFEESHTSTTTPDLYDALKISYSFTAGYSEEITASNYKQWTELDLPTGENHTLSTIDITIEFLDGDDGEIKFGSANNDNQYQNCDCTILFSQLAVQGNAYVDNSIIYNVSSHNELQTLLDGINNTSEDQPITIKLADANYGDITIYQTSASVVEKDSAHNKNLSQSITFDHRTRNLNNVTIEATGEGAILNSIKTGNGACGVTKGYWTHFVDDPGNDENYTFDTLNLNNITIRGITFVGEGFHAMVNRFSDRWKEYCDAKDNNVSTTSDPGTINGLVIENCKFERDDLIANSYGGIYIEQTTGVTDGDVSYQKAVENVVIKNCTFKQNDQSPDRAFVYFGIVNNLEVDGCLFDGRGYNAIQVAWKTQGVLTITNNTFKETKNRYLRFGTGFEPTTLVCEGNKFYEKVGKGFGDYFKHEGSSYCFNFGNNQWENAVPEIPSSSVENYQYVGNQTVF